jgi:hypothetical protein
MAKQCILLNLTMEIKINQFSSMKESDRVNNQSTKRKVETVNDRNLKQNKTSSASKRL